MYRYYFGFWLRVLD